MLTLAQGNGSTRIFEGLHTLLLGRSHCITNPIYSHDRSDSRPTLAVHGLSPALWPLRLRCHRFSQWHSYHKNHPQALKLLSLATTPPHLIYNNYQYLPSVPAFLPRIQLIKRVSKHQDTFYNIMITFSAASALTLFRLRSSVVDSTCRRLPLLCFTYSFDDSFLLLWRLAQCTKAGVRARSGRNNCWF